MKEVKQKYAHAVQDLTADRSRNVRLIKDQQKDQASDVPELVEKTAG
jgi:hypothetical protein